MNLTEFHMDLEPTKYIRFGMKSDPDAKKIECNPNSRKIRRTML
jgi:hypothetical protein